MDSCDRADIILVIPILGGNWHLSKQEVLKSELNSFKAMTKAEREAILNVLARNEELKSNETARIQ